jgi:hypothetical protein
MQYGAATKPAPVFHLNTGHTTREIISLFVRSAPVLELGRRVPIVRKHKSKIEGVIYDDEDAFVGGTFIAGGLRLMLHLTWAKDMRIGSVYGLVADANNPMVPRFAIGYWSELSFSQSVWTYVFRHYLNAVVSHAQNPMRIGGDAAVLQPELKEGAVIATLNPQPMANAVAGPCNLRDAKNLAESIAAVAYNYRECGTPHWTKFPPLK